MATTHWLTALAVLALCSTVRGQIMCYECTSWTDPLCSDPFNFTLPLSKQPPTQECDGCCVKLVQHIGTPYASVRRTCTDKMRIKLFVVDRVCMREGGGRGHMCFCEEDLCNAAPPTLVSFLFPPSSHIRNGKPLLVPSMTLANQALNLLDSILPRTYLTNSMTAKTASVDTLRQLGLWWTNTIWNGQIYLQLQSVFSYLTSLISTIMASSFDVVVLFCMNLMKSITCAPLLSSLVDFCTNLVKSTSHSPVLVNLLECCCMTATYLLSGAWDLLLSMCLALQQTIYVVVTWPVGVTLLMAFHKLLDWSRGLR